MRNGLTCYGVLATCTLVLGSCASPVNPPAGAYNTSTPNITPSPTGAPAATSNPNGTFTFNGSVAGGYTLKPQSALFAVGPVPGNGGSYDVLLLMLSDQANACALVDIHGSAKSSDNMVLVAINNDSAGNGLAPTATTYNIPADPNNPPAAPIAEAQFFALDGSCNTAFTGDGIAGNVMITSTQMNGSQPVSGDYNITLGPDNDTVSGTFTAAYCPALLAAALNGNQQSCH